MADKHLPSIIIAGAGARILEPSDPFEVTCDVNGCLANCCTKSAPIILNPYEIALICRESGMSYEDLLDIVDTDRARSFPLVMLPRDPACHFWTGKGCRIYAGRPLACRLYPLGRVFEQGYLLYRAPGAKHLRAAAPDRPPGPLPIISKARMWTG